MTKAAVSRSIGRRSIRPAAVSRTTPDVSARSQVVDVRKGEGDVVWHSVEGDGPCPRSEPPSTASSTGIGGTR